MALPSITGSAARAHSPSPRTAVPSVTTATVFRLMVSANARWVFVDGLADARHARRVGHGEVVARLQRAPWAYLDLAAEVEPGSPVTDVDDAGCRARQHGSTADDRLAVERRPGS